jgi:hypothetical protein
MASLENGFGIQCTDKGGEMPLWEQVKYNLAEWYAAAADKTEELARIGMRRYDKFGISRDIERQFSELGSLVYEAVSRDRHDFSMDPAFRAIVERIRELELELKKKEEEIDRIRESHRQRGVSKAVLQRPDSVTAAGPGDANDSVSDKASRSWPMDAGFERKEPPSDMESP